MTFQKHPRIRLEQAVYRTLHQKVLERDGWRCQNCGRAGELHVHHMQPHSLLGGDVQENLITLCAGCHRQFHERRPNVLS